MIQLSTMLLIMFFNIKLTKKMHVNDKILYEDSYKEKINNKKLKT